MKIAFIPPYASFLNGPLNGITTQTLIWMEGLSELGCNAEIPPTIGHFDDSNYDIVHVMQFSGQTKSLLSSLKRRRSKVVFSPIIDPSRKYGPLASLLSKLPFENLRLIQNQRDLRLCMELADLTLARSKLELESLLAVTSGHKSVRLCKIGFRLPILAYNLAKKWNDRENFVFHASSLCQDRKNVKALVSACIDLKVELRLAGRIERSDFQSWLRKIIHNYPDISYLGVLSDESLFDQMRRCRVFCLPSKYEGVGLAALEALACGANIVVTKNSGSSDYLESHAIYVDPARIESIRVGINAAFKKQSPDIQGSTHVLSSFSPRTSAERLLEAYSSING